MQETCLQGVVATAYEYTETMGEIKLYQTIFYGPPRILFDARVKEFAKLGKLSAPAWKRKDWHVNIKNQTSLSLCMLRCPYVSIKII